MIRFYNGRVLTLREDTALTGDEVWVDGGLISYVGPAREDAPVFEREIDLKGDLLMPGFKNAHTHSAMTFCRSYADDLPLHEWLFDKIFPMEARLNPDTVYALTKLAILEYLAGGITAGFDMYFHRDAIAAAALDTGFRMAMCGALSAGDSIDSAARDIEKFNAMGPLVAYYPGIHAEYTANDELIRAMSELLHTVKLPFYTHNSETRREVDECLERRGVTPTVLFEENGLFDFGGGGFHCVYLNEADMDIFRRRGLWAVTCPGSNAKLASGIAPITALQEKGVKLAIGTDGPSSNNALNMFREMYLVTVLQKLREQDAAVCDAAGVLDMACRGGARAMGFADCDSIQPGKRADLVVMNLSLPNMQPIHNVVKNLVYSGSNQNVRLTMIEGRVLYENGEFHVGESVEDITRQARKATDFLTRS